MKIVNPIKTFCRKQSKHFFICLSILCLTLFFSLYACTSPNSNSDIIHKKTLSPDNLRINLMSEPLGVELDNIRFSWQMNDSDAEEIQTAYRIVVFDTVDNFHENKYIYDSQWINSSENTGIKFDNSDEYLKANSLYYWAVATKDKDGNISDFSMPQAFTTELSSKWQSTCGIWASSPEGVSDDSFVFLRNKFKVDNFENIEKVVLSVTATSTEPSRQFVYNIYLNGNCIGVGPCREGIDENGLAVLYYNSYDITSYVSSQENVVSAINYADDGKQFLCQITAFYKDGNCEVIVNSGKDWTTWKSLQADDIFGKDNSIGTGYYTAYANNINAMLYPFGFSEVDFDDSGWLTCNCGKNINDNKILKSGQYSPVKRYVSSGVKVKKLANGDFIIDLQQEIIGGIKIGLDGEDYQKVQLYYGEQLNNDGTVKWHMNTDNKYVETFTLKQGRQIIETVDMLTYRYVQISGYTKTLTTDDICGVEIRAPFNDDDSSFTSDSLLLNDIYALTKATIKYTTQDILVDSQSRERRCYEGDLLINALSSYAVSSNFSSIELSLEYAMTHKTFEDYILLLIIAARQYYMYTGDSALIKKYYRILKEKCFYTQLDTKIGLAANSEMIIIDWPENDRDDYDMEVEYNTAFNCLKYKAFLDMADIAEINGDDATKNLSLNYAALIKQSVIEKLYNKEIGAFSDGIYANGMISEHYSQHATFYALWSGIYENDMKTNMVDFILSDNKMKSSVFGSFFLLDALYNSGNGDSANKLMLDDDTGDGARTWAYMIKSLGATLTTEAWNESIKNNMTFSHPWSASPAYFIQSGICGIEPVSAGFTKFRVSPSTYGLNNFNYEIATVQGNIKLGYLNSNNKAIYELSVPSNTTAQLFIECEKDNNIYTNGVKRESAYINGLRVFEVGSGNVMIEVR